MENEQPKITKEINTSDKHRTVEIKTMYNSVFISSKFEEDSLENILEKVEKMSERLDKRRI